MSTNTYLPTQNATGARMDVGDIPNAAWNATGVVSLLVGLFWMLATGRIVTRRELDTRMSDKDEQIRNYREAAAISAVQTDSLASIGEMQVRLLKSIEELSKRRSGE